MADEINLPSIDPAQTANTLHHLRTIVHAIAISVFILAGTFSIFIYRQAVLVGRENRDLMQFLSEYERSNTQQVIDDLRLKLGEYTKQHADFVPIYAKYFGSNQPAATGPVRIPTNTAAADTNRPAK